MPSILGFPVLPDFAGVAVEAGGQVTGSTDLTNVAGGTANNFGSWVTMISSLSKRAVFLIVCVNTGNTAHSYNVEIGYDSTTVVRVVGYSVSDVGHTPHYFVIPTNIPAGSAVKARLRSSSASYGMYVSVWAVEAD